MKRIITAIMILTMSMTAFAAEYEIGFAPPDAPEATQEPGTVYGSILSMTEEETELLRAILALETTGEPYEGVKAACEVIFNRILSDRWPNSLTGVIYQRGQFASVKYLKKPYAKPGEIEDDAISDVLRESTTVLPDTSYVFFDRKGVNGKDHVRIGKHLFGRGK